MLFTVTVIAHVTWYGLLLYGTMQATLAYVAPQLAGAIDVVVVKQPDGSLKSSPIYGKNLSHTSTILI